VAGGSLVTRWDGPRLELARPPARPRTLTWLSVMVWVGVPAAFWGGVALLIAYKIGAL
jgi:hypothetical protein